MLHGTDLTCIMNNRLILFFGLISILSCIPKKEKAIESQLVTKNNSIQSILDPLQAHEITNAVSIFSSSQHYDSSMRYSLIELEEPIKGLSNPQRKAFMQIYDWAKNKSFECIVNLSERRIEKFDSLGKTIPLSNSLVHERVIEILNQDVEFEDFLKDNDLDDVTDFSYRIQIPKKIDRLQQPIIAFGSLKNLTYFSDLKTRLLVKVNLASGAVDRLSKTRKFRVLKPYSKSGNAWFRDEKRLLVNEEQDWPQLSPLSIKQEKGPGYTLENSLLKWQQWNLNFGLNPRRGLEIYNVSIHHNESERSVLYRANLSEAVTPYGDPAFGSFFPSDIGDFNLSNYSLRPIIEGADVPPNATLLPAVSHNHKGQVSIVKNAIAIYERDAGLLWRHNEESRRARELVLMSMATIDNYDYAFQWIFDQVGNIKVNVILSGQINYYLNPNNDKANHENNKIYGIKVTDLFAGPIHQHFFNYRIDFDVDGVQNSLFEMNIETTENENQQGEWFYTTKNKLETELKAQRKVNIGQSRWWKVSATHNAQDGKKETSYGLIPQGNAFPKQGDEAPAMKSFPFLKNHLQATAYEASEMYAAGRYINARDINEGTHTYAQDDEDLNQTDIVLWYTFGMSHLPRPEDWPYMPKHEVGFKLMPFGFFEQNPAIGIPYPNPWK